MGIFTDIIDNRNKPKRGLVDEPGSYSGRPLKNPKLAEKRKQKWIKNNPNLSWDDLGATQKSRVYSGKENVGIGKGKNQPKTKNPESVKKMIESKTFKTLDDYSPKRKQNILNYFAKRPGPEMSIDEIEKEFFSYNRARKSHIAGGRLTGAPSDDKTALSRIYREETIPGYIQELDDEILRLTKEHSNPNKIKSELYKIFNDPKYTQVPEGVEAYNVFFNPKTKKLTKKQNPINQKPTF